MKKEKNKDSRLEEYLRLPYTIKIIPEKAGGFFAKVEELPGCITQGEDITEVWENIQDAMFLWLETAIDEKTQIPEPDSLKKHSGKFLVRLPTYIHKRLVNDARSQGISLNQYVVVLLSDRSLLSSVESKIDYITVKIEEQTKAYELLNRTWAKVSYGESQKDITLERDIPEKNKWLAITGYGGGYET